MGFKNRGYKYQRDTPDELVRDYKLFAIACEGSVREPQYFKLFQYLSKKIKVDIIEEKTLENEDPNIHTKSSPKWVLDKAMSYINNNNLLEDDELWFVMDVDKWSLEQLRALALYCKKHKNWNLVLSNPCFEIWLYFHKKMDIQSSLSTTCKEFKTEISLFDASGYDRFKYVQDVLLAVENAKKNDSDTKHYFPKPKETKVYQLVEALIKICPKADFQAFLEFKIPELIEKRKAKMKD